MVRETSSGKIRIHYKYLLLCPLVLKEYRKEQQREDGDESHCGRKHILQAEKGVCRAQESPEKEGITLLFSN